MASVHFQKGQLKEAAIYEHENPKRTNHSTQINLRKLLFLHKIFLLHGFAWPLVKFSDEVTGNLDTEGQKCKKE